MPDSGAQEAAGLLEALADIGRIAVESDAC